MIDTLMPLIKQFLPFAGEKMGFKDPPRLFLRGDSKNAKNPLGKTAHYDPSAKSVTLYTTGRHPKDVMRSLSHELVHHTQNCRGDFDDVGEMGEGYAQNDSHLREMEREAYEVGNMCFRDWEDSIKSTIYFEHLQRGENKMSTKDWKNNEISQLLSEAWGFKFNTLQEFDEFNGTGEIQEERDGSGVGHGSGDDDPGVGKKESEGEELSKRELSETGAEDTGASKGDKADVNEVVDEDDEDPIDERASMEDAHPQGPGRKTTKTSGERVTSENAQVSKELRNAILEVLRKHF
jgi:hypothetical protein